MTRYIFGLLVSVFVLSPNVTFALPNPDLIVQYINDERLKLGVPELIPDTRLVKSASIKVSTLVELGYLLHTTSTNGNPWSILTETGYHYSKVGENLSLGHSTAKEVVDSWMASVGHRENILNPNFTHIGAWSEKGLFGSQISDYTVTYFAKPKDDNPLPILEKVKVSTVESNENNHQFKAVGSSEAQIIVLTQLVALLQELIREFQR